MELLETSGQYLELNSRNAHGNFATKIFANRRSGETVDSMVTMTGRRWVAGASGMETPKKRAPGVGALATHRIINFMKLLS
jgi:hypothetical protein